MVAGVRAAEALLSAWTFDPVIGPVLLAVAAAYAYGVRRVQAQHPAQPWPVGSSVAFFSGVAVLWVAILGPIGAYDDTFLWAHMVQHVLMTMVATPLMVIGSPVLLLLRAVTPRWRRARLVPILRSRVVRRLTNPLGTWVFMSVVLVGVQFSPLFEFAVTHRWAHLYLEHPLYVGAALLYYYPLVGDNPIPRRVAPSGRIISLALMMAPEAITGFFLYASAYPVYPYYFHNARPFGPPPLSDQQLGGAFMWSSGMILDVVWMALAVRDWLRDDARRTRRIDAGLPTRRARSA